MLNSIDIWGLQYCFGSNSAILDNVALMLTDAWTWAPLYIALLFLIIKNNDNMQQICMCFGFALLCVAIASIMANVVVKPIVERPRPCNTLEVKYLAQIAGDMHSKDYSFFSSHAANTMSLALFFALLVKSRLLTVTLFVWSLTNCWTRLYLGQHYLTDIMVGIAWGLIAGALSYFIFRKVFYHISRSYKYVSSQYTKSGYSQLDVDVVVSVFVITIMVAFVY